MGRVQVHVRSRCRHWQRGSLTHPLPTIQFPMLSQHERNYRGTNQSSRGGFWRHQPPALGFAGCCFPSQFCVLISIDPFTAAIAGASFAALYLAAIFVTKRGLRANGKVIAQNEALRVQAIQEGLGVFGCAY